MQSLYNDYKFGGYKGWHRSVAKVVENTNQNKLAYTESAKRIITREIEGVREEFRLALVTPVKTEIPPKDSVKIYSYINSPNIIRRALQGITGLVAIDLETRGTQAADPDSKIVGLGLATFDQILYFDIITNTREANAELYKYLQRPDLALVGHNILFDSAFLLQETGHWYNWTYCTYGLYRQLANEGHPSQSWGLKQAQIDLLNWPNKGDVELDNWLIFNKYIRGPYKQDLTGKDLLAEWQSGEAKFRPDKSEMWRAPADILGYYCGLDCASTYQLFAECFAPSVKGQIWEQEFWSYHQLFIDNVRLLAEQQLSGIKIDTDKLRTHQYQLLKDIDISEAAFLDRPEINKYVREYNEQIINEYKQREPAKYKKLPELGAEPAQYTKTGKVSKNWENWCIKRDKIKALGKGEISKNWQNWADKFQEIKRINHFNINSGKQLIWLFYEKLNMPVVIRTKSGEASTGVKVLPGFGELGQLLKKNKDLVKELGYVDGCFDKLIEHWYSEHRSYRIHPQFKAPGTLTCRLAGSGGLNLQQLPKSRGYLSCWIPSTNCVFVDCDHTSLEQVVMAELSKDKSLYKIYGPNAKPNDVYLFNGSQLPVIGDKIRAAGYNPDSPDKEMIAKIKKECKKERTVAKVITLGSSYGMGWEKLQLTLKLQGIDVSKDEAQEMIHSYWDIYSGVKDWERQLLKEYRVNNGWVLNGIGRPVCCAENNIKDLVNRVVQSTGHDIHMLYSWIVEDLLIDNGIQFRGIVWDFHDQSILECSEQDAERVAEIMGKEAYILLNDILGGVIPLSGDAQIVNNLAQAKLED